mgnify:CR=1 FL=1|jgi:septal ring factor EnvC (AmiA/AmiB activator)
MDILKNIIQSSLFGLLLLVSASSTAQDRTELEKQRAEIQAEIEQVKRRLDETSSNKKETLGQLALLQRKLRLRESAIRNLNQQITSMQRDINKSRNEIATLKKELDTLKSQYAQSIVYAYKNRSNYEYLNFIFSATSFNDALKRVEYLKAYRKMREQHANDILATQELLAKKIEQLEKSIAEKDSVLAKQQEERKVLVEETNETNRIVNALKSREKELNKELTAKRNADQKLKSAISAAIAREAELARERELAARKAREAANPPAAAPSGADAKKEDAPVAKADAPKPAERKSVFEATPEGAIISDNFEKNKGRLPWPIDAGNIKIPFGTYGIPGTRLTNVNPGLTLETAPGADVKAVFGGVITSVFNLDGSSVVLVQHGKYFTGYSGLRGVTVKKGQQITAGEVLGKADTGEIEFLLMLEKQNLDPEAWLRKK